MSKKALMPRVSLAALAAGLAAPAAIRGPVKMDGGAGDVAALLKEVRAKLDEVGSSVKQTAETALKQAQKSGDASAEVKATADKLLVQQHALSEAQAALTGRLEQLETRATDIEQRAESRRDVQPAPVQTLGQRVAAHEDRERFVRQGCKGSVHFAITSLSDSAGALIESDRAAEIVGLPRRRLLLRELFMPGRTGSNAVEFAKQVTRTNNAAVVSETVQKPQSAYAWTLDTANVKTIAHWVPISRQAMEDAAQLATEIDGELRYGLDIAEENAMLTGDGVGENISGINTTATAFSPAFNVDGGNTRIDALRLAILQVQLADYDADGMVLHPTDWAQIELQKDSQLAYLFANPLQLAGPVLWGRAVVPTTAQTVTKFTVGPFRMAATIYDRMETEVAVSSEDRDNFVKNMLTARAEKRLAFAVKRPTAIILGDFDAISA